MRPYDVIVIGDVPAAFFSATELHLIYEQVSTHGAGLMWIGGSRDNPVTYATSPLAPLLPMLNPSAVTLVNPPISLTPTPAAEALGVLRLRNPENPDETRWPKLPPMTWAQSIGPLKPAVDVLATDQRGEVPLISRLRFGAGQSLFIATDESWRWRYGRGELYAEQYWMQLIRLLARGRLQTGNGANDRARLLVSSRRAATGDTLVVEVNITDQSLLEKQQPSLDVTITPIAEAGAPLSVGSATQQTLALTPGDRPGFYRATWSPRTAGKMSLKVASPALADMGLEQTVIVERADDELRRPATDHPLLAELAQKTGGSVVTAATLKDLATHLPDRARRTPADISEPLWNSPLAFALLLLLLTGEWIGRKFLGLA